MESRAAKSHGATAALLGQEGRRRTNKISGRKYGPIWRVTIRYLYTVFLLYLFNK